MEKANVTLYTVIGDSNRIVEAIRERFKEMTKEFVCEDETIDLTLPVWNTCHLLDQAPDEQAGLYCFPYIWYGQLFFAGEDAIGWTKRKCLAPDTCVQLCDWDHFRSERQ